MSGRCGRRESRQACPDQKATNGHDNQAKAMNGHDNQTNKQKRNKFGSNSHTSAIKANKNQKQIT